PAAPRTWVALADLGGQDRAVRLEVTPSHQIDDVPVRLVGAGHPTGAGADPGIDQVANPGGLVRAQHLRTDVATHQLGVGGEVLVRRRLERRRVELRGQPLLVDLAVTGD